MSKTVNEPEPTQWRSLLPVAQRRVIQEQLSLLGSAMDDLKHPKLRELYAGYRTLLWVFNILEHGCHEATPPSVEIPQTDVYEILRQHEACQSGANV